MKYDPERHHRRSIRLPGYDYSQEGAYFVTLVCKDRMLLLEDTRFSTIVEETWRWLADQYSYVHLDEHIVMPNHLHAIILIDDVERAVREPPLQARKPLGRLIGAFKTVSTKRINGLRGTPGMAVWQRNYYEHIIRDEEELHRVREYIIYNPEQWEQDAENPAVGGERRQYGHQSAAELVGAVREPPWGRATS